jgi:predicted dehydrogenase
MIRVLHVGVGIRGGHWVDFVREHADFDAVGFVDVDQDALDRVATGVGGVATFTDLSDALGSVEADAVVIASPTSLHAEHARQAMEAGLVAFVEKPFAHDVAAAEDLLAASRDTGKPVMVAENYRFRPAERTVAKLVADGVVGPIDNATLVDRRNMPSHTEGPWLAKIEYPQLQEIAIHHFDSLRFMLGERPRAMMVRAWNPPRSDYAHGACTEGLLEFERTRVQYLGTLTSVRFAFSLTLEGEGGEIWTNRKQVFVRHGGSRFPKFVRNVPSPKGDAAKYPREGTTSLLNALRDLVVDGRVPETIGADNIWNVAMLEAGRRSDREGRRVRIEEVYAPASDGRNQAD